MVTISYKDFYINHNLDEIGIDSYSKARIEIYKNNQFFVTLDSRYLSRYTAELILEKNIKEAIELYVNSVEFWLNRVKSIIK